MIITQLTLHNFGVYAGTNQFQFENKKPVVLIGGMNGRGKTTFLEAVLLALYGSNSYAYTESRYHTYGQYLKSYVNIADGTLLCYVELSFKAAAPSEAQYTVHREWSGIGQRVKEKISVQKDGVDDPFLTEHWSMFIESILPSGLSNFFFFDGEKIAGLAVEETNAQMKDSIRALLGVTVLDRLENDLGRIVTNISKESVNGRDIGELERLRVQKKQAEADLQAVDDEILALEKQVSDNQKVLAKVKHTYSAKGGNLIAQKQELFHERAAVAAQIKGLDEDLIDLAAGELPFCLIPDLLDEICIRVEKEHDQRITKSSLERIDSMSSQFLAAYQTDAASIERFIEFVRHTAEEQYIEPVYNLSDPAWYQAKHLRMQQLKRVRSDAKGMMEQLQKCQDRAGEIDSYLSIDIDEKVLARLYKQIKQLEQIEIELSVQLDTKRKKRAALHAKLLHATAEYSRFAESFLKALEHSDDSSRMLRYAQKAVQLLEAYRIRLQENKVEFLAKTMTDCYKKIASKKNMIDRIHMDPVTLDFQYVNAKGETIPKASLSAGEKQLMVISLLWSLAICSKWKLPVMIDTPLSRLDSTHRLSLISSYFPYASDQTIILSTDSEIDEYYYSAMKDTIGDEFTLVYDDERKCSTIKKGYFIGERL